MGCPDKGKCWGNDLKKHEAIAAVDILSNKRQHLETFGKYSLSIPTAEFHYNGKAWEQLITAPEMSAELLSQQLEQISLIKFPNKVICSG